MRILALDLGTKTGFATDLQSGTQDFSLKRGDSPGMRPLRLKAWLEEMIRLINPHLIAYEETHHRGGAATQVLNILVGVVQMACAEKDIEHTSVHTATLKKFATGSGRGNKEDMIRLAKEKFKPDIIDDNEADALWVLEWAKKEFE